MNLKNGNLLSHMRINLLVTKMMGRSTARLKLATYLLTSLGMVRVIFYDVEEEGKCKDSEEDMTNL